jgi:hypothetical protein
MRHPPFSHSLALAAFIGLSLAACSGGNGGTSDAGAGCPVSQPTEGTPCLINGTTCNYGGGGECGGGTVAICSNGSWGYEATPGVGGAGAGFEYACPATIPAQGSSCSQPPCGGAQPGCTYGCDQGGPAYATCNGSTWQVTYENEAGCIDAPDASDAGDAAEGGTGCRAQSDCGSGAYCQAPGGPFLTGYALGPSCTSDAACSDDGGAGSPWCNGGPCVCQSTQYAPRPEPGMQGPGFCMPPCATDADCAASPRAPLYGDGTGFVCGSGGHCVPKSCSAPTDCPAHFDCSANQCVRRSCTTDTDCGPSGACVDGACFPSAGTCQGLPA